MEDVTYQKRMEETLRQTNEELQAIYDGMVDGVLLADAQTTRFVRANAAIVRMLGYPEDELLRLSVLDIHPSESVSEALAAFQAMKEGRRDCISDLPCRRKDGTVFHANVAANRVVYRGRPCAVGFFRDVTERREAEAALQRERRELKQLLEMHERERQLVAYEVHDGLAQHLAGAILRMQTVRLRAQESLDAAGEAFDRGMELLEQSMAEARRLISGLRPPILDESGIVAAIEHLACESQSRGNLAVAFETELDSERLPPPLESAVYRIVQEGMANACRHSKSDRLVIRLSRSDNRLCLEIRDWGVGFDPQNVGQGHHGLQGIAQRARAFGGRVEILSAPGKGTSINVEFPLGEAVPRDLRTEPK